MTKKRGELAATNIPTAHDASHIATVKSWIVSGRTAADILTDIRAQFLDDPNALLAAALGDMADEADKLDTTLARGFLLNAFREVYRQAMLSEDYAAAISALRSFERVARV